MKRPDWKNPNDYAYLSELNTLGIVQANAGWAWEFLRRNHSYQNELAALKAGKLAPVEYQPTKKIEEADHAWVTRCVLSGVEPHAVKAEIAIARRWGLKWLMYDPSLNALELHELGTPVTFSDTEFPKFLRTWDDVDSLSIEEEATGNVGNEEPVEFVTVVHRDQLVVVFDLTVPWTLQGKAAQKEFDKQRSKLPEWGIEPKELEKPHANAFRNGIRALDGLDAKAANHQIGSILFKGTSSDINVKIHNCLASAKKNRDGGYRAIAKRRTPIPFS